MQNNIIYNQFSTAELQIILGPNRDDFTIDNVRMLIQSLADPNVQGGLHNSSALYYACRSSNLELFTYLVSLPNVRLDIVSNLGRNIIHLAVGKNTDEYIKAILKHKRNDLLAMINSRVLNPGEIDFLGFETPLLYACKSISAPVNTIRILLDNGADITSRTRRFNESVLHLVIESMPTSAIYPSRDYEEIRHIIELLLERGADINAVDRYDQTALYDCVSGSSFYNIDVFRLLLYHGADVDIPSRETGVTARQIAERDGDMREILDEYDRIFIERRLLAMGIGSEPNNHSNIKVIDEEMAKIISKHLWMPR